MLIDSCLSSLPMYMMGMYILSKGVHSSFNKDHSHFLWKSTDSGQKYHVVKGANISLPKDMGGVRNHPSFHMNVDLMLRLIWWILHVKGGFGYSLFKLSTYKGGPSLLVNVRRDLSSMDPSCRSSLRFDMDFPFHLAMEKGPFLA